MRSNPASPYRRARLRSAWPLLMLPMLGARAEVSITLTSTTQFALAGGEVEFAATLTNASPTDKVHLNDIQLSLTGDAATRLALAPNTFFANVPGILLPGESYTGPLARIAVAAGTPPAAYAGSVVVVGGAAITATGSLSSAGFTVSVLDPSTVHSADTNADRRIGLLELTRVIELFNTRNGNTRTGGYAVATSTTEDGFVADPARSSSASTTLTRYHSADTNRDGKLSLLELTRVIELYNYRSGAARTGQYHLQSATEDGFAPGP